VSPASPDLCRGVFPAGAPFLLLRPLQGGGCVDDVRPQIQPCSRTGDANRIDREVGLTVLRARSTVVSSTGPNAGPCRAPISIRPPIICPGGKLRHHSRRITQPPPDEI